jgi:hypothetical protein
MWEAAEQSTYKDEAVRKMAIRPESPAVWWFRGQGEVPFLAASLGTEWRRLQVRVSRFLHSAFRFLCHLLCACACPDILRSIW